MCVSFCHEKSFRLEFEPLSDPDMSTKNWPAQHHYDHTACEKLCEDWGSELHLKEQKNGALVIIQTLLWVFWCTSL